MFSSCGSCGDDAATGMVPVLSSSGEMLAPCGSLKMLRLLKSGKAVACFGEGETFYLKLRFDPKSPVMLPKSGVQALSLKEDMDVWRLIPPRRRYIEELAEIVESDDRLLKSIRREERAYIDALLKAKWHKIKSPAILKRLAPTVKAVLKCLAEDESSKIEAEAKRSVWEGAKRDVGVYPESPTNAAGAGTEAPSILERAVTTIKRTLNAPADFAKPQDVNDIPSADDLIKAREFGKRKGTYYKLRKMGSTARALLEASILYLRKGSRITSSKLKHALETIMEMLQYPSALVSKIISRGLKRARELADKVAGWAPQLLEWIKSEAYIFWLGLTYVEPPT